MSKKKNTTKEIWSNVFYGLGTTYSFSKSRVICQLLNRVIEYILWVFYSAYFVRFVLDVIQKERPLREILVNIAVIGGVSMVLRGYQHYCNDVIVPLADIRVYRKIYQKIYRKSENVELGCFEDPTFYNKFSIALDGIGNKLGENVNNLCEIAGGLLGGVLATVAMVEIDPWTVLFLIAPLVGNFIFAPKVNAINYARYKEGVPYDRKIGYVNRVMYLPKYAKELRLYHIFHVIRDMLNDASEKKSEIWKKYFNKAFLLGLLQYIFSYVIIFEGILLYGAYRAIVAKNNPISFSQMAVLTSVMVTASWVWVRVINAYNRNTEIGLAIGDLRSFLSYRETIAEDSDGVMPEETVHSIEFDHVTFSYDGEHNVIEDMSWSIRQGEKLALVGHNGAGKTTIIKLLLRLYDPTKGIIRVNGTDIREYNLAAYRALFSCAFQDYQIFAGTVRDNVLMGRKANDEKVREALAKAGIYEKIRKLPKNIDTVLTKEFDEQGALLSGGEFQKLVCARVFLDETKVSLFDEPSSALDPISESELFNSIIGSVRERTGIFISHRLSSVKEADRVFMLEHGRVIEQGTHRELMKLGGAYSEMYKIQERNYFTFDRETVEAGV